MTDHENELREALNQCRCAIQGYKDTNNLHPESVLAKALAAAKDVLDGDIAGSDYISKESVKPLVGALLLFESKVFDASDLSPGLAAIDGSVVSAVKCALAHAKSIGIPTETEGA